MEKQEYFFGCACPTSADIDASATQLELARAFELMRPRPTSFGLVCIGGAEDGAYLVPDDLGNVRACFSPGASNRKSFEDHLTEDYDISCHVCDFGSDQDSFATAFVPGKQTFDKLWLEPHDGANHIDLRAWTRRYYDDDGDDFLLQMDIEGGEYRNILAADVATLARFRIIVVEVHGLRELANPAIRRGVILPFFEKLVSLFTCVHAHPNNYSSRIHLPGESIDVYDVMEFSFIRSDIVAGRLQDGSGPVSIPHPMDIVNAPHFPPAVLSEAWCGGARPLDSRLKILEQRFAYEALISAQHRDGATRAILHAVTAASAGALTCLTGSEGTAAVASLAEVATGRPYATTSAYGGFPQTGRVASRRPLFFHTDIGWDQHITIDLESERDIRALSITNRTDGYSERAATLYVALCRDGTFGRQSEIVYPKLSHSFVCGKEPGVVLQIPATRARFVRIGSAVLTALHFAEIKIYAAGQGEQDVEGAGSENVEAAGT